MSQYGLLPAFFMSFYSRKLYRDVAENWGGKAFAFLFIVLALSWIGFTIQLQIAINAGFKYYSQKISHQIPLLTVKDGVVSTPENRQYIIKDPDHNNEVLAIIDTTGTHATEAELHAPVFINKTEIITHKDSEIRRKKIPADTNLTIDPIAIQDVMNSLVGFAWLAIFPLLVIFSFVYRVIEVMVYAIFGKVFSLISSVPLSYGQITQLMMVALAPVITLATVIDLFAIHFAGQLSCYFLLAMAYLLFAVLANRPTTKGS